MMLILKKESIPSHKGVELHKKNNQANDQNKPNTGIILHYTVGHYHQVFDSYHFNIFRTKGLTNITGIAQTLKPTEKGQHIWGRNSGLIGITMCCLAKTFMIPTDEQLEYMALTAAENAAWQGIDIINGEMLMPELKQQGALLVPTGKAFLAPTLTDHAFFGVKDKYGSPDIGKFKNPVISRAKTIYKELKAGKRKFQLLEILK